VIGALKALGLWPERQHHSECDFEAIYNYTDGHGNLLYQVVRKTGKKFLQRRPDGAGGMDLAQASPTSPVPPSGGPG
jgi:hypothetical protein